MRAPTHDQWEYWNVYEQRIESIGFAACRQNAFSTLSIDRNRCPNDVDRMQNETGRIGLAIHFSRVFMCIGIVINSHIDSVIYKNFQRRSDHFFPPISSVHDAEVKDAMQANATTTDVNLFLDTSLFFSVA